MDTWYLNRPVELRIALTGLIGRVVSVQAVCHSVGTSIESPSLRNFIRLVANLYYSSLTAQLSGKQLWG